MSQTLSPVRIKISNFQSIEHVDFEVRGFTCITGKTNIGKSALMRAISSSILNDPVVGKVRKGTQFCTVDISSADWGFKWEKGERGVNRYTINDKVYDKVGQKQIEEIISMGFGSIKVGDQEIQPWWASQFFPLFLLDKSGAQVTDFISEVSRLTVLQDAIVLSARGKRQSNDEAKIKSEESDRFKERLSKITELNSLIQLQKELDEQAESIRTYEYRIALGESILQNLEDSASKIRSLSSISSVYLPDDTIGSAIESTSSMHRHWTTLESCAKKVLSLRGITKTITPEAPSSEYDGWILTSKLSKIHDLKKTVDVLKKASTILISDSSELEVLIDGLSTATQHQIRVNTLQKSVNTLSSHVNLPSIPDEIEETSHIVPP